MKRICVVLFCLMISAVLYAQAIDYDIIVSPDAIPSEKNAARMLAMYLGKIGCSTHVVTESSRVPSIWVGQSPKIAEMLGIEDFKSLKPDEIILKSVAGGLVISGDRPRGTLYAVYSPDIHSDRRIEF